jgi:type II secretory pathway pseudopilin PulG
MGFTDGGIVAIEPHHHRLAFCIQLRKHFAHISGTFDMSTMLIGAAVAIPNLLRSRMAANDAAAASTLRTVNTAEITYATTYPKKGYARDLATMGPGPGGDCSDNKISSAHACLLDDALGCTSGTWCTKRGFRFRVTASCNTLTCANYVAVATPVDENTGTRSYCSTSDAVVRTHTGPPLASPVTAAECRKWPPIQ